MFYASPCLYTRFPPESGYRFCFARRAGLSLSAWHFFAAILGHAVRGAAVRYGGINLILSTARAAWLVGSIKATPRIRNVYYCGFGEAALPPEFSKRRPVIVFSHKNALNGPILVVPITTQRQTQNPWATKLERNPTPGETCEVWAVCNHLYTVSCARLTATHGIVPRLTAEEFLPIHRLILKWIPTLEVPLGSLDAGLGRS